MSLGQRSLVALPTSRLGQPPLKLAPRTIDHEQASSARSSNGNNGLSSEDDDDTTNNNNNSNSDNH
jgi:hypothetical protein